MRSELKSLIYCACEPRCEHANERLQAYLCPGCKRPMHENCGVEVNGLMYCYTCKGDSPPPPRLRARPKRTSITTTSRPTATTTSTAATATSATNPKKIVSKKNSQKPSDLSEFRCTAGQRCQAPQARQHRHKCPGCGGNMHSVCGVYDESQPIATSNWCYECHQKKEASETIQKETRCAKKTTKSATTTPKKRAPNTKNQPTDEKNQSTSTGKTAKKKQGKKKHPVIKGQGKDDEVIDPLILK